MRRRWPAREHKEMGVFFYSRGAYDLAIAELKRALKAAVVPLPGIHVNLGVAYLAKGMHAEARDAFRRALALDPTSQKARWFLGRTLKAMGSLAEALAEFERAYVLNPESPEGQSAREAILRLRAGLYS